jgi:hypothetical protein
LTNFDFNNYSKYSSLLQGEQVLFVIARKGYANR